jgi:subtilisin-like proprotein convertase family protein
MNTASRLLIVALALNSAAAFAGTGSLNDYNPNNYNIPDAGSSVSSDLALSGAPSGATITKVKIYYEIRHTYSGDLKVWLTTYYNGAWHDFTLKNREGGGTDNIIETRDNLTTWNGASPNQTWYLVAQDMATGDTGYIDFFELWVTYSVNDAPNTPSSEDPSDGATGVSISKDLDWSCSDPNSDTLYYTVYFEKNDSSPDVAIKTDATGSAADPGTLDYDSNYYWQVKADDHKSGVTWGPVWDFYTEAAPVIAATITIQPIAAVIQGNTLSVDCEVRNDGNVTRSFGVGAEIKDGSSVLADLGQRTTSSIGHGSTATVNFTYAIPLDWTAKDYTLHAVVWSGTPGSSDWLDDDNETFSVIAQSIDASITVNAITTVQAGHTVTIPYIVANDGNVSHTFGIGAEIWKDGVKQADVGSQTTPTVSPGATTSASFTYDIPEGWSGTYVARCAVWTGTPGSSTWLDSFDRNFTVTPVPLSLNGRIAYHSYSDYMAAPVDSIDGNAFVYKINGDALANVTDALAIDNSMNPHFSPDGSRITFMAIPSGATRNRSALEVYVYDLAEGQLSRLTTDSVPDEDPKFSPDGLLIVWKRDGQVWRMQSDGTAKTQLTTTGDEKSGPNYSPDGTQIAYWSSSGQSADVWRMNSSGAGASALVATANIQDYYPIFRDNNNVLYSRWESTSDHHDKVYNVEVSSGISTRLAVNVTGVEDADAAPVDATHLVFSSTRSGGKGSYDILIGRYDNGGTYTLGNANSAHKDLGACYSPYTYARKVRMQAPANGATLTAGASYTIQVRAYSDGGIWSGASPSVNFQGPNPQTYTDLRDDGTGGDSVAGDGIYSKSISLPASSGAYTVTANAQSVEPGATRQITSSAISVTLNPANSAPTDISLSASSINENVAANSTVGTLSTTDPDAGNTFTYTLVSGAGSTDNAAVNISSSSLRITSSPNYEAKNTYSVRVRTTDQGGLWYEEALTITINDVNETPTDIALSASAINENVAANSTVGTLSTTDPDAGNTFTCTLVSGTGSADNGAFNISGSSLRITASPNYEAKNSYSVRVRTTDQGGLLYEEAFTITINDVNETAPTFENPQMRVDGTVVLQWSSITNHLYTVHHSTNILSGFTVRQGSIQGTPPMNSYTDTVNGVRMKFWTVTTEE